MSDPIVEIDMQDPANFRKAIGLALASTDPGHWGPLDTKQTHALAGDSTELWAAYAKSDDGRAIVVAVTGNGPTSEANAEFLSSARKIVLGLVSEVDRLQTILRNRDAQAAAEFVGATVAERSCLAKPEDVQAVVERAVAQAGREGFHKPGGEGGEAGAGLPDDPREGKGPEVAALAAAPSDQSSLGDAPASPDDDAPAEGP
jgi:hypothetical protein